MMEGREVVIVEAVRTPVGRGQSEKGYYASVHPNELLGSTFLELIRRAGIPADEVEDVVTGCVGQYGEQGLNTGRNAWLQAGLPIETAATTVDRQCGSAQQAVNFGAALVGIGAHDVVIGCGVEHMGHLPLSAVADLIERWGTPFPATLLARFPLVQQGLSAELISEHWQISRQDCDEIALRSQHRAAQATAAGRFDREIMPFGVDAAVYTADQGIRATTLDGLAALKPAFKENGTLTAGNSSQVSDGAAAVLLMTRQAADRLGLRPRARIVDQLTVGVDPVMMLTGPIPATRKILSRNGMRVQDLDLIEINEAFASVVAAWEREIQPDIDKVNVNGGAIALGHPLGSTGARLIATLLHELERSGGHMGLVTMCCGGGLGTATLIERL
jgi:acetyl-CoA acetyltransferase family protein